VLKALYKHEAQDASQLSFEKVNFSIIK